nr:putative histone acetyltransferase HAC-like 1 [Tanacetum cinerariifolium]
MDVKTTFLNGDLDEEVYMKQPEGFVMSGNEHKELTKIKLIKLRSSSRFSMKDMGKADVILGIKIRRKNKGIVITQSHYIEKILKKFIMKIVLRGQGAAPLAESRGRAPCWGPAARSAGEGRGGLPLVEVRGQRPDPNGIFGTPNVERLKNLNNNKKLVKKHGGL